MKISLFNVSRFIILFGVLITPFFNIGEVYNLMSGNLTDQAEIITPLYIKAIKDLLMINIIFIMLVKNFRSKISFFYLMCVLFFIVLTIITIANTIVTSRQYYVVYGLRWLYPIFIFILGVYFFDKKIFDSKFELVFIIVFLVHFGIQIFQFFSGLPWFGLLLGQYATRSPGIFLLPNTAAFFSVVFLFYFFFLSKADSKLNFILPYLAIISTILTSSGTGFVVIFLITILRLLKKKFLFLFPLFLLLAFQILIIVSPYVRDDYIKVSGGTRVQIFLDAFEEAGLFSSAFGYFTNAAYLMETTGGKIMDSTYASFLGNLGILPFLVIVTIVFYYFLRSYFALEKVKMVFLSIVLLFSGSTIVFEAYPMNMLLALIGSVLYRKRGTSKNPPLTSSNERKYWPAHFTHREVKP